MGDRWFGGDRTVAQQMTGLDQVWPRVVGKSVLDVGCAEGYIAFECERKGAREVYGVDNRPDAIRDASKLARQMRVCTFEEADANHWTPPGRFEVLLLLGVLHKMRQPAASLGRFIERGCEDTATAVLRTRAGDWPILRDARSGFQAQDLRFVMYDHGFSLVHEDKGPKVDGQPAEFVGIFERVVA